MVVDAVAGLIIVHFPDIAGALILAGEHIDQVHSQLLVICLNFSQ
jgi:hypothetical protein